MLLLRTQGRDHITGSTPTPKEFKCLAPKELKRSVAQWLLNNYGLFTDLLEIAIFAHRQRAHLNWNCRHGHGDLSLDGMIAFNIFCPVCPVDDDDLCGCLLIFNFTLERHNQIWITHSEFGNADHDVFRGDPVLDLLVDGDFIHFERCDMSDVAKAHKLIRGRLKEFAE